MIAILSGLMPILLSLIGTFLRNKNSEVQTIEAFYKFIEKLDKDSNNSVKLHDSYKNQLKALSEQRSNKDIPTRNSPA